MANVCASRALLFLETPGVQRQAKASLEQVGEEEASGASTLYPCASFSLGVLAWMPFTLRLHPVGDLEPNESLPTSLTIERVSEIEGADHVISQSDC